MNNELLIGIVGDDFTGSSDAASFLVKAGLKTMLFDGIPNDIDIHKDKIQAVVIALKSRMAPIQEAKSMSYMAAKWLYDQGAKHIYSKYCSTFDSTKNGNIGPILDNFIEKFNSKASFICPALPINGRKVENGILYINDVPLAQSPMKDHPLTPMWDSSLKVLMEAQSKYPCFIIKKELLYDEDKVLSYIKELDLQYEHYYLIPDYMDEDDAKQIAKVFGSMFIQSGGSGILTELGKHYKNEAHLSQSVLHTCDKTQGKPLLIAGSCSVATQNQINRFIESGNIGIKIDADKLMSDEISAQDIFDTFCKAPFNSIIYSTDSADVITKLQKKYGVEILAQKIENLVTEITQLAYKNGFTRYIVAGGETSGALMRGLPKCGYLIGNSVAPGVPIMTPSNNKQIRLVLKSGNFGDIDFFKKALSMTGDMQ